MIYDERQLCQLNTETIMAGIYRKRQMVLGLVTETWQYDSSSKRNWCLKGDQTREKHQKQQCSCHMKCCGREAADLLPTLTLSKIHRAWPKLRENKKTEWHYDGHQQLSCGSYTRASLPLRAVNALSLISCRALRFGVSLTENKCENIVVLRKVIHSGVSVTKCRKSGNE